MTFEGNFSMSLMRMNPNFNLPGIYTLTASLDGPPCFNPELDPPVETEFYPLYDSEFSCGEMGIDIDFSE